MARTIRRRSLDPSTKVGAVIVNDYHEMIASGYNGFPRGVGDNPERWNNRSEKSRYIIHAERNAFLAAAARGAATRGCSLFVYPFAPCFECAKDIVQAGIVKVYHPTIPAELVERWGANLDFARQILLEGQVTVCECTWVPTK